MARRIVKMADFHLEIEFLQRAFHNENVCGDVFQSKYLKEEGRRILVLSDGMGHGVKANVLAILTATMTMRYSRLNTQPKDALKNIMRVLPRISDENAGFSTFTIIEIQADGIITIVNYENPPILAFRGNELLETKSWYVEFTDDDGKLLRINYNQFKARKEDRVVFVTDGITQSGMGRAKFLSGWGIDHLRDFVLSQLERFPDISALRLCRKIVNQATLNDEYILKDDISCGVIYIRQPRDIMIVTGPPFYKSRDRDFALKVKSFRGARIVCGGTTSEIIARELDLTLQTESSLADPALPPKSSMEGFELVTEGILTIGKVEEILENYSGDTRLGDSPSDEIVKLLLQHDKIYLLVGTRINWAHQDPDQPFELEIRKFVVKRIVRLLEEKFFKVVQVDFV
ncbi:MAG: SpoIIE family protein phosphatase [Bacteroidota bacterium]|nr:SpoIIE family protein phosphatase [Bacteroidota bacterium]MDP4205074.1 SpoIIE family protein phosphatase [Bacteroidota bacterium]